MTDRTPLNANTRGIFAKFLSQLELQNDESYFKEHLFKKIAA